MDANKLQQKEVTFMTDDTTQATSQQIDNNWPPVWDLAAKRPETKLNIIFDIDHTLIFTIPATEFPEGPGQTDTIFEKIRSDPKIDPSWLDRVHKIYVGETKFVMWLVVRYGVLEMLEYLSTFCNFYVYSHGLKAYIDVILEKLDPEGKYFKDRHATVLAPKDIAGQKMAVQQRKGVRDLRDPKDPTKPLLSEEEIQRTLIIDDQISAIRDQDHLIVSKKFVKFCDQTRYRDQFMQQQKFNNFFFPDGRGGAYQMTQIDYTNAHRDFNRPDSDNQIYSMSNLLTRLYLIRTLEEPKKPISLILKEYRSIIFKDHVFSFPAEYLGGCNPSATEMTPQELENAKTYKKMCSGIIMELGGVETDKFMSATHLVIFQEQMEHKKHQRLQQLPKKPKVINFKYITECFFQMMQIDLETENGQKYLVKAKQK